MVSSESPARGLRIQRFFTKAGLSAYDAFAFVERTVDISDPQGNTIFFQKGVEAPASWSQTAVGILAQKYFRRQGVPQNDGSLGGEHSLRQVVHRMAACWTDWGNRHGYFGSEEDRSAFYDEVVYLLLDQRVAPNSPQWFNTGLFHSYGIKGPAQGHYHVDASTGECRKSDSAYEHPQPHGCFILSVKDDLVNPGGIMDLWVREARVFKYGSGCGTNYSSIRGASEPLSGGGSSSGLMSFLKIGDVAAGAIRSGGTTRRAAKMVCLDADHPEIIDFIRWKSVEEKKARSLIAAGYSPGYEGEAYRSVSGQNSNNSVRLPDSFMQAVVDGGDWILTSRTDRRVIERIPAGKIWDELCKAAWECADPGVQFDTTINDWHTCPSGGRINASNPCSEYLFLDDTACNLASINLIKFYDTSSGRFRIEEFEHACRIMTIVLEISVLMAQYPSEEVARNSVDYRTLGLGYANLGGLLMAKGLPYGSSKARAVAGAITALMTGTAYSTSSEMAALLGPFKRFRENRDAFLHVLHNHRAALEPSIIPFNGISKHPPPIDWSLCDEELLTAARNSLFIAERQAAEYGLRNAQVTVIAPTGTISLVMDCDTTGIEPEYSLVRSKSLSGGGELQLVSKSFVTSLVALGYGQKTIGSMEAFVRETGHVIGHPDLKKEHEEVFHCALPGRDSATGCITPEGHLSMMAAVQPFLSGGISKTINLPAFATREDVAACFLSAWRKGLKSVSVYRDGCKSFQPLRAFEGKQVADDPAPPCADCGYETVRSGSCFRCTNCGSTVGCS
jgi:ribonucleoside-diphosphate reductase alpha chain